MTQLQTTYASGETGTDLSIVPYAGGSGAIMPVASAQEMRAAIRAYEDMKAAILQPSDIQKIGTGQHIKRSGWVRIARAFGITVTPASEAFEVDANSRDWGYSVVVRAVAPNGAAMIGDGACWASEKAVNLRTRHNVRAHAYTRATNRAISNLVGGGEVSADELTEYTDTDEPGAVVAAQPTRMQPKAIKPAPDAFERLHLRAVKAASDANGTMTLEAWEDICQEIGGAIKPGDMTPDGKRALAAYVAEMERHAALSKTAQAEADAGAFPAEANDGGPALSVADDPDALTKLGTGHGP